MDQLYVDLRNHLTVITANRENWVTDILPHIAMPQHQRLSSEILLEGIRKDGARELGPVLSYARLAAIWLVRDHI
jgi:hypothetical protein